MKKIILSGQVGYDITSKGIISDLDSAKGDDIEVHLASPGGSVFDGIQIYNAFRDYKRKYPEAQMMLTIKGLAASMASYIAVNPAFDLIFAEDNAILMIHNVQGGAIGDYREMQKTADIFERLTDLLSKAYTDKTGISNKEIRALMDAETWYYGEEIYENGYVDEILKTEKEKSKDSDIKSAIANFENMFKNMDQKIDIYQIAAMLKENIVDYNDEDYIQSLYDEAEDYDINMPYPNEHSARVRNPGDFQKDSFRRKNIETGIDIIIGRLKGKTTTTAQAYRFKKDKFTVAEAKKWLKDHKIKYISFEPASGSYQEQNPADAGKNIMEGKFKMTLKEFLEQNPAAEIEYNNMLKERFEAGAKLVQDKISSAMVYLKADSKYPGAIKNLAIDIIDGKYEISALTAAVASYDAMVERENSEAAQEETNEQGDTPPTQEPQPSADGIVRNETDLMAIIDDHKRAKGMEVN